MGQPKYQHDGDPHLRPQNLGEAPECLGSWARDAEEGQGSGGVAGVAAQGGGDVASAVEAQDRDGEVAQAGHGPGGGVGADLGGVLGVGGVADVVQRLDAPSVRGGSRRGGPGWPESW
jgi:hypothetical protein